MSIKIIVSWIILSLFFVQCKENKDSSKSATIATGEVTSSRVEKLSKLIPELIEIRSIIEKRNDDYSPDYFNWRKGNRLLKSFVSNQDINLFNGNYARRELFLPHVAGHKYRFIVNIQYPWMDTEIELAKGKTYYIIVNGIASTSNCKTTLWIGPEGKKDLYNKLPYYSVIGKLGDSEPFFIGKEKEITINGDGKLFLGYNDDLYVDNIGYYVVDILEMTKEAALARLKVNDIDICSYYAE